METETFQHYRILRREDGALWELGRGAMAVTYKAFDVNLCYPVALKVINVGSLEDEHTRARFVREARAAAALRHRNIASVYHLGSDEQNYFYAMEFVDGETVEDLVARRGPLPSGEALDIAAQVARALGAAAKQGLIHRDIKPANLMVAREDEDDEGPLVKVIDFGLARRAVTDAAAQITLGGFVGTPQYASPEQIEERDLDVRSDIYSLGVTLWFMLTGRPTFAGSAARVGSQHLHDEPPWAAVAHLPAPVRALLTRTLQKKPADRPQDPAALRHEIAACLDALAEGSAATDAPPAPMPSPAAPPPLAADLAGAETVAPAAPLPAPEGAPPAVGDLLAGRYSLLAMVGEGRWGRVFRAGDERQGGRTVAVKVWRAGLDPATLLTFQADFRRLRAAPHPRLLEALTCDETHGLWFLASEWVNGFTLVDLLRHRGSLEQREALQLLAQASDAAAHGSVNGLRHLALASHEILVHFPRAFDGDPVHAVRAILDRPLAKWPVFGLKVNALTQPDHHPDSPAPDVPMTLVPAAARPSEGYFHPLGALLYELLSGTPPPPEPDGKRELPPLPMLGEEANELLQRALSPRPGFRDEREFFDALLAACRLKRGELCPGEEFSPAPIATRTPDVTQVPPATPSADAPAPALLMAAPIRTKLLRPPPTALHTAAPPRGLDHGWRARRSFIIVVIALVAVGLGTVLVLRAARQPSGPALSAPP